MNLNKNANPAEQALRDLRSLWLVPTFILSVVAALLFFVGPAHGFLSERPLWAFAVLAVFLFVYVFFHRRAQTLAAVLRRREVDLAAARDQLEALDAIGRAVAAELDLDRTLQTLCEQTASLLDSAQVAVALRERSDDPGVVGAACGFSGADLPPLALLNEPSVLAAPIVGHDGLSLGTLYAKGRDGRPLRLADQPILTAIATQASIAIANAHLYEQSRRRGADLRSLVQRVAQAAAADDDLGRIASLVADQTLKLVPCDGVGLFLLAEDRQTLLPVAFRRAAETPLPDKDSAPAAARAWHGRALTADAFPLLPTLLAASAPVALEDVSLLGEAGRWASAAGMRALIATPLRGRGQATLGVLLLHWRGAPHRVDEEELSLVAALAGFAGVAAENARLTAAARADQEKLSERYAHLLEETRRRGEELQTLIRRVGEALAAGLSRMRVAELVVAQAREMIPCQDVVFSVRDDDGDLHPLTSAGTAGMAEGGLMPGWRLADFPFLRSVLERSHPVVIADVAEDGRLEARERAALRREDIATMLLAPLHGRGDRVIGLLSLFWRTNRYAPTPDEFDVARVLATQAATALENARLYQDLEQAEAQLKARLAEATAARDFVDRILQNIPAAVLVLSADAEGTILTANAPAEAMPDPAREQDGLVGRRLADVFPGLDTLLAGPLRDAAARGVSSALPDVAYDGFMRGTTHWSFSITPQRDPATRRVAQIIVLALETTDRIRLLRENERIAQAEQQRANELDATLRSLGDGVALCDPVGRLVSVNRAGQAILGEAGEAVPVGESVEEWAARIRLRYPSGQPVPPGAIPLARALRARQATDRAEFLISAGAGQERVIEMVATPVLAAGGVPDSRGGAVAVFRDITELQQSRQQEAAANRRVQALVEISARLNGTLVLEEIHGIIAEGAKALLPRLEDVRALLYGFEGEGKPLTLLAAAPDERPRRPRALRPAEPHTVPFDASSPLIWQVYVARKPALSGGVEQDPLFESDTDRALLRGGGPPSAAIQSALVLPLLARDAVSGHLVLTSSAPRAFEDPSLVDALTNLAALALIARVNGSLYLQMKQRADELDVLWNVGQAIASKLDLTEVVDTLTDRVRAVMGCEVCTLALFEKTREGGRRLSLQGAAYQDAMLLLPTHREPAPDPCDRVGQEAAHTGEPATLVGLPNPPLAGCRWRAFAGQSGTHSVLAVPLKYGDETLGALTVYRAGSQAFPAEQVKLLSTLASLAVAAVRNAQTFAHEQNIAETLQKSFLPESRTQMPGLDIAERYYPTLLDEARIGGDYYDFIRLGPQRLAVIIGDISGKGLRAAVYTAMAKYSLRAFAAQDFSPREVVTRANVAIARYTTGEIFSTLFYGVIDLAAGTLTYVNAGHEPPQLRRAGGDVLALESTGLMVGAFADSDYDEACLPVSAGDVVALFTDGLSDVRAPNGAFFGEEGIRASLASAWSQGAEQIADALHRAALDFAAEGRQRDDICLLVVKVLPIADP